MILTRENTVEYFKKLKEIEEKEKEIFLRIRNDDSLSTEKKKDRISYALSDKEFEIKMTKKNMVDSLELARESEGYIKILAEININVYTKKDHSLLKDLLKSKGFESNDFEFKEGVPAFKAMIGSNNKEGLNTIIKAIDDLCGENNIFFESKISKRRDVEGTINVQEIEGVRKAASIMSELNSPIIIGSKVGNVINFTVGNGYNFSVTDKVENNGFLSFDQPKSSSDDYGIFNFLLKKLPNPVENDYKAHMLERNLSAIKSCFQQYSDNIKEFLEYRSKYSKEDAPKNVFDPELHKMENPKLSDLKCYQIELHRIEFAHTAMYMETYNARKEDPNIKDPRKRMLINSM